MFAFASRPVASATAMRPLVEGGFPGLTYPRVPGHEAVGKIDALGHGVEPWRVGQRVGVGFLGGHCGICSRCRRGDFVNCERQPVSGVHTDGGYAEVMIAKANALVAVPDQLASAEAAPVLSKNSIGASGSCR